MRALSRMARMLCGSTPYCIPPEPPYKNWTVVFDVVLNTTTELVWREKGEIVHRRMLLADRQYPIVGTRQLDDGETEIRLADDWSFVAEPDEVQVICGFDADTWSQHTDPAWRANSRNLQSRADALEDGKRHYVYWTCETDGKTFVPLFWTPTAPQRNDAQTTERDWWDLTCKAQDRLAELTAAGNRAVALNRRNAELMA